MYAAGLELMHDFGRRQIDDLDAVEAVDHAAITTLMSFRTQAQASFLEERSGGLLEAALGGHGDGEWRGRSGHHRSPLVAASRRSVWIAAPTAGTSRPA